MKIAIVTFELEGLTRNGGIGTAFRRLADVLADAGHSITVFYMPFGGKTLSEKATLEIKKLARRKIKVILPESVGPKIQPTSEPYHIGRSYLVYEMLKAEHFDVVHASDNGGLIYFSLLAKRLRLNFATTRFVMGTHGCLKWVAEANGIYSADSVLVGELDHLSIEMADHVVSPSAYMLDYREAKGWLLPADSRVIGNINDLEKFKPTKIKKTKSGLQKTLVFFGRIERRKGIFLFINAIEKLMRDDHELGVKTPLEVVLLGSAPDPMIRLAVDQALMRLAGFSARLKIKMISDLSSDASLAFLSKNPRHLVCMPSLIDNFPYVIVEAVERRLDFIASSSGGQGEIISEKDHSRVLCPPTVHGWAQAIASRLTAPRVEAQPSKMVMRANHDWLAFHKELAREIRADHRKKSLRSRLPKVSIVITHLGHYDERINSLRSALNQNYQAFEILIPESSDLQSSSPKVKTYPSRLRSPSAIADYATGKYLLFLDGGIFNRSETLAEWVQACESQSSHDAKIIGFAAVVRHGVFAGPASQSIPLPAGLTRALIGHTIANTFTLWNRHAFIECSHDGDVDLSHDSSVRPFIARTLSNGFTIATIPLFAIVSLTDRFLAPWDIENIASPLENIKLGRMSSSSDAITTSLLSFYSDMVKYRNLYYERGLELETAKNPKKKNALR